MFRTVSFFKHHPLPVFGFLSSQSREALEQYLTAGNASYREKVLLEFFKSVDWLTLDELYAVQNNPVRRLSLQEQVAVYRDIKTYLSFKARQKTDSAKKRQSHKMRVIEYFRKHVPRKDKELLERLRDYELDLTGRDKNWQHYFTLQSFKRIDQFIAMSTVERQQLIRQFKQDVLQYRQNLDKLRYEQERLHQRHQDPFSEWAETADNDRIFSQQSSRQTPKRHATSPVMRDFATLGLPDTATLLEAKKQFRQLALKHHPDVPGGSSEKMKQLVSSYERVKRHLSRAVIS